jgi:hypothetical protein
VRLSSRPSEARPGIHNHKPIDESKALCLWIPDSRRRRLPG